MPDAHFASILLMVGCFILCFRVIQAAVVLAVFALDIAIIIQAPKALISGLGNMVNNYGSYDTGYNYGGLVGIPEYYPGFYLSIATASFAIVSLIGLAIGTAFKNKWHIAIIAIDFINWAMFAASAIYMITGNKMFSSCPFELSDSSYQYQPITVNAGVWLCIIPDVATGLDIICWILFTITLGYSIWDAGKQHAVRQQPVMQDPMNITTPINVENFSQIQALDVREGDGLSRYQTSKNRNLRQEQERHTDEIVSNHQHSARSPSTSGRDTQPIYNENRSQSPAARRRPVSRQFLDSRSQTSYQAREYAHQSPNYERGHEIVDYTSNNRPQSVNPAGHEEIDEGLRRAMSPKIMIPETFQSKSPPDGIGQETGPVSPKVRTVKRKSVPSNPLSPRYNPIFEKDGF